MEMHGKARVFYLFFSLQKE